jgi:hypothetical protein
MIGRLLLPMILAFPSLATAKEKCLNFLATKNSRGTQALFERRHLQGGGPTWIAILGKIVDDKTTFVREAEGDFGVKNIVLFEKRQTWYVADEEGEGAIFCTADVPFFQAVRAEYNRLNKDAKALEAIVVQLGSKIE